MNHLVEIPNSLVEFLNLIDPINMNSCHKLYADNKERFEKAPGSLIKHQAWPGGYVDHLMEIMNIGIVLYEKMSSYRQLPFSISDFILVLFLHDLEKPFKYIEPKTKFDSDDEKKNFINEMIKSYGIKLNPDHENALKYIHGEGEEYSATERIQGPLAAFCHICDTASARIWFDYPETRVD